MTTTISRSSWAAAPGITTAFSTQLSPGIPSIADLDADGAPEIVLHNTGGLSLIQHDGAVTISNVRPTGAPVSGNAWHRPSCIHDFDGNGDPEIGISAGTDYGVFEPDLISWHWLASIEDETGVATGTAFDFLGDGGAEAMYADEIQLFVFDDQGEVLLQDDRSSRTIIEYPVVTDVDNDGSAEIIVVSNEGHTIATAPTVQVFRDVDDRWIQARRIWNQHAYHVTNVREDGTIPTVEAHHWASLNTFRTNAQIGASGVCSPRPAG